MRPVLHTDLITAASALLTVPRGQRWRAARDLVMQADAADRYRQRTGKAHADWGNGTLMAAALARGVAPERRPDDPDYAEALILVLEALRIWRLRKRLRREGRLAPLPFSAPETMLGGEAAGESRPA